MNNVNSIVTGIIRYSVITRFFLVLVGLLLILIFLGLLIPRTIKDIIKPTKYYGLNYEENNREVII